MVAPVHCWYWSTRAARALLCVGSGTLRIVALAPACLQHLRAVFVGAARRFGAIFLAAANISRARGRPRSRPRPSHVK